MGEVLRAGKNGPFNRGIGVPVLFHDRSAVILGGSFDDIDAVIDGFKTLDNIYVHIFCKLACIYCFRVAASPVRAFVICVQKVLIRMERIKKHIFDKEILDTVS